MDGEALIRPYPCTPSFFEEPCKVTCTLGNANLAQFRTAGLIWVGERYYPTPDDFRHEASTLGISRRIPAVPRDLVLGVTWVLLAHRLAIPAVHADDCPSVGERTRTTECEVECADAIPGIFYAFRPQRVEYVVTGNESEDELEALEGRGLSLVEVIPDTDPFAILQ